MEGFNCNSSNFSNFEYSWEQHPNFFTNIQDDNTYPSFSPPHQDWNDTLRNTFDQSWEGNYDYSCNFQRSDPCYGFTPFDPNYPFEFFSEQPEPSHSFETLSPSLVETLITFFGNFISSLENMNNKIGQLVDELKNQSQNPLPSDNENFVGEDENSIKKELEWFEANFKHLSKPSLLSNNEEDESSIKKELEWFEANFKHLSKPSLLSNNEEDESSIKKEIEIFEATFKYTSKPSLLPNSEEVLQDAKISNLINFAHVVQPSLCDDNAPKMVTPWTVGRICVLKISEVFLGLRSLGRELFTRNFGIVDVSIILKPLHFLKMHMWGGESHPT